uniref:DUF3336 domain-containing protein n=1 Tax=Macrostomum lignano TaxID=282301 RepID=A0A1I8H4F2_9PLAT
MNFQSTLSLELYAGMEVCFKLMVKSMRPLLQTLLLRFSKALWSMVLQTMMLTRHRRNPQASRHSLRNGQTKDCNWDEFKRLVQAEATNSDSRTTALFRLNNIANQKQTHLNQQISSVLAALYETRATLRILVTIIADELLKDAIFLCNILTAVMQVTENKYIINHQLLKSKLS